MTRLTTLICAALLTLLPGLATAELGDDGLHRAGWIRETFKDLREDLAEANEEGKRLLIMVEQRGCIYCTQMHEEVYPRPEIADYIEANFFVVRVNLHGDTELTDFDGEVLTEKQAVRRWGVLFTPTLMFIDKDVPEDATAQQAAVAIMPGAFGAGTTIDMMTWVVEERYTTEEQEDFQRYHARRVMERDDGRTD
jgi:thioredoxin-related protein